MKKILVYLLILVFAFPVAATFSLASFTAVAATETLNIYNWGDYMDMELLDAFVEYYNEKYDTNLTINYETFDTNEIMLTKVLMGDSSYDLICPSEYTIEKLMRKNMLKKLDFSKVKDFEDINPLDSVDPLILDKITEFFGELDINGEAQDMKDYMIPYMWGTLGILYNVDSVTEEDLELGWGLLWNLNNNPDLKKKILMKDSVRDSYVAAVLFAKEQELLPEEYAEMEVQELINTVDDVLLPIVEGVLKDQQDMLRGYEVDFGKDDMIRGVANACLAWSGDALYAIEEGYLEDVELDYYVPESGSNLWFDGWAMPVSVKNEIAALEFMYFMLQPESAILNMMEIGYTSAVDREMLMDNDFVLEVLEEFEYDFDDFFADEIRYPHDYIDVLGVMKDFGDKSEAVLMMWENIKPGATTPLIIILSVIIGIIGIVIVVYLIVEKFNGGYRIVKKENV